MKVPIEGYIYIYYVSQKSNSVLGYLLEGNDQFNLEKEELTQELDEHRLTSESKAQFKETGLYRVNGTFDNTETGPYAFLWEIEAIKVEFPKV